MEGVVGRSVDFVWSFAVFQHNRMGKLPGFGIPFVRLRYLDTWQGRSIRPGEAKAQLESLGLEVLETDGEWTTMMWMGAREK